MKTKHKKTITIVRVDIYISSSEDKFNKVKVFCIFFKKYVLKRKIQKKPQKNNVMLKT